MKGLSHSFDPTGLDGIMDNFAKKNKIYAFTGAEGLSGRF